MSQRGIFARSIWTMGLVLALAGCGGEQSSIATIEVSSVPTAQIWVDGVQQGMTPATLELTAGQRRIELRQDEFAPFVKTVELKDGANEPVDAVLLADATAGPAAIELLASAAEIDVAPFVAPELTRGASSAPVATLLWPKEDVREQGLSTFAIEVSEKYAGDATLEYRLGRKVLYSEPFTPESMTTVREVPAQVRDAIKRNKKVTWGLYFEDSRRPLTASFRVVDRPKAEKQLTKLFDRKHIQRQPVVVRRVLAAKILENNRLYTEALIENLRIAADNPTSTMSYEGIVTTLRRLDGKDSELWSTVAPLVGGGGKMRPSVAGRPAGQAAPTGRMGGPLAGWTPPPATGPNPSGQIASGGTSGMRPSGGSGLPVPPVENPGATPAAPAAPGTTPGSVAPPIDPNRPTDPNAPAVGPTDPNRPTDPNAPPANGQPVDPNGTPAAPPAPTPGEDGQPHGDADNPPLEPGTPEALPGQPGDEPDRPHVTPETPGSNPVQPPASLEEAVRRVLESGGQPTPEQQHLLATLGAQRQAEQNATSAVAQLGNARRAEAAAEATVRSLGSGATDEERAAAEKQLADAQLNRGEAEKAVEASNKQLEQAQGTVAAAMKRAAGVAKKAAELMNLK
jgi:hypothetical protein